MSSKIKTNIVSNLKALSAFEANFDGNTAIITGRNNSGKSSFLRSLPDRLRGIKPEIILKEGEEEGFQKIELTTGETFLWSFDNKTAKGERLIFITKDAGGNELKGSISQEIAKKYFPPTFDIDEFLQASPQKQKKILETISGLDFTVINDRHKVAYDDRTFANKKLAEAKANLKPIISNMPTEENDVLTIQHEIAGIDAHNKAYSTAEAGLKTLEGDLDDQEKEIKRLESLLKAANSKRKEIEGRVVIGKKWVNDTTNQPKKDDVNGMLQNKLQEAQEQNEKIRKNNEAIKAKEDVVELDIEAKQADRAVKAIELEKMEMIKKSNLPEGFDFSDDGILYQGLPVTKTQLSSSGIYIAALKLAATQLGEVKTLFFDASYLDKNSLAEVEKWAIEEGGKLFGESIQLLIERPDFQAGDIRYELIENIQ